MPIPILFGIAAIGSSIAGAGAAAAGTAAAVGAAAAGAAATGVAAIGGAAAAAGTAVAGAATAAGTAALGTAAAAGTAVTGAATAAGTAALGAATAAGTAVTGAAAAAETAALGAMTAAGTAATGAVTAAGTAVTGTVAAAETAVLSAGTAAANLVANTPVIGSTLEAIGGTAANLAAGVTTGVPVVDGAAKVVVATAAEETGKVAVGTAVVSGTVGGVETVSGAIKLSKASAIKEAALANYRSEKAAFEKVQESTNSALKSLGEDKLKIWESFERFSAMYSKIQNTPTMTGEVEEESLSLAPDELDQIKAVAITARDLLVGGVVSIAAGKLIGCAAMGGLTAAPMLMVGGIMLNIKGQKALEAAEDIQDESDKAIKKMKDAEAELEKVRDLSRSIHIELGRLNSIYCKLMDQMEAVVSRKTDYRNFSPWEKRWLEKTVLSLKLLKQLSMQNILDPEKENTVLTTEVNDTLNYVRTERTNKLAA